MVWTSGFHLAPSSPRDFLRIRFLTHDRAIDEVDLLVLTKQGFWLVEFKSRPGRVEGDAGTRTWADREGRRISVDNPLLLANRKAKALSSLLKPKMIARKAAMPWLEAIVFLSDPETQIDLPGSACHRVALPDREAAEERPALKGILATLINREVAGDEPVGRATLERLGYLRVGEPDPKGLRSECREGGHGRSTHPQNSPTGSVATHAPRGRPRPA